MNKWFLAKPRFDTEAEANSKLAYRSEIRFMFLCESGFLMKQGSRN